MAGEPPETNVLLTWANTSNAVVLLDIIDAGTRKKIARVRIPRRVIGDLLAGHYGQTATARLYER
jgi:hypothetical protein